MKTETRPVADLLFAFAGPIVWAGHFFAVYLSEALLCPAKGSVAHAPVRPIGILLTVLALAAMLMLAMLQRRGAISSRRSAALFVALPLTLLSALAMIWTTLPMFLLAACVPGGA
jgi:hypothetical protein